MSTTTASRAHAEPPTRVFGIGDQADRRARELDHELGHLDRCVAVDHDPGARAWRDRSAAPDQIDRTMDQLEAEDRRIGVIDLDGLALILDLARDHDRVPVRDQRQAHVAFGADAVAGLQQPQQPSRRVSNNTGLVTRVNGGTAMASLAQRGRPGTAIARSVDLSA